MRGVIKKNIYLARKEEGVNKMRKKEEEIKILPVSEVIVRRI